VGIGADTSSPVIRLPVSTVNTVATHAYSFKPIPYFRASTPHTYQGLKKPLFCVPTDELLRAKDDLLSEGGQSLSSLTEQVVRQSLQPNRHLFSLLQLTKAFFVVICIFYLFHGQCLLLHGRPN